MRHCIVTYEITGPGSGTVSSARMLAATSSEIDVLYLGSEDADGVLSSAIEALKRDGVHVIVLPRPNSIKHHLERHRLDAIHVLHWLTKYGDIYDTIIFRDERGVGYHALAAQSQGFCLKNTTTSVTLGRPTAWILDQNARLPSSPGELEIDFMERECVRMCDTVFATSKAVVEWARNNDWLLPNPVVLWPGLAPNTRAAFIGQAPEAQKIDEIVFVGTSQQPENLSLFIKAISRSEASSIDALTITFACDQIDSAAHDIERRTRAWACGVKILSNVTDGDFAGYLCEKGRLAVVCGAANNSAQLIIDCLNGAVPLLIVAENGLGELIADQDRDRVCLPSFPTPLAEAIDRAIRSGGFASGAADVLSAGTKAWLEWCSQTGPKASPLAEPENLPRVSVCLVHFNRPHLLRHAIESLRQQDYPNLEIVLVDGGSTLAEARTYLQSLKPEFDQRGWKILFEPDRYIGAARNAAASRAAGDFILFMDDDNVAKPFEISHFVRAAMISGADILTCANSHFSGEGPAPEIDTDVWTPLGGALGAGCFGNCFGDANAFFRKGVLQACGGFSEIYGVGSEDWELFSNAVAKGFNLAVIPYPLYWYRFSNSAITPELKNSDAGYRRSLGAMVGQVGSELGMALQLGLKVFLERQSLQEKLDRLSDTKQSGFGNLDGFKKIPEEVGDLLKSETAPVQLLIPGEWRDYSVTFDLPLDVRAGQILGWVFTRASEPLTLRVAMVDHGSIGVAETASVLEKWLTLQPGLSLFHIDVGAMRTAGQTTRPNFVHEIRFGGSGWGEVEFKMVLAKEAVVVELISQPGRAATELNAELVLATSTELKSQEALLKLQALNGALEEKLNVYERQKLEMGAAVQRVEASNRALARDLEASLGQISLLEQAIDRVEASAANARAAIFASSSWRLTAPIRTVTTIARDPVGTARRLRRFLRTNGRRATARLFLKKAGLGTLLVGSRARTPSASNSQRALVPFESGAHFNLVMFIGCWEGESKRYRVLNVAAALKSNSYSVKVHPAADCFDMVQQKWTAEAIVFFRTPFEPGFRVAETLSYAKNNQIKVIFDIDDLVFEPGLIHTIHGVSILSQEERELYCDGVIKYRKMLEASDLVTVATLPLARAVEAIGKPVAVIPNSVNQEQIEAAEALRDRRSVSKDRLWVGYFSGSRTHERDFACAEAALLDLMRSRKEWDLVIVGYLQLGPDWDPFLDRVVRKPFVSPMMMLALLNSCDVNIAPLEIGDPFCEAKSELKFFEAALVGVPTVASATEPFCRAIDDGVTGYLAYNTDDWFKKLDSLMQHGSLRRQMGVRARTVALEQFGIEATATAAENAFFRSASSNADGVPTVSPMMKIKIDWIIPRLLIGGGGHRNILRAAHHMQNFGHEVCLHFTSSDDQATELGRLVHDHFYPFEGQIKAYDGHFLHSDVIMATHWTTVAPALKARSQTREVMYFVQDFEPAFAPMGSEYVLAENTYRQGLYCITSGQWCEEVLKKDYGVEADHFIFPIDRKIYWPRPKTKTNSNIVFFAKPEMPRRGFEIGAMALAHFHHMRPDVEIILFGSKMIDQNTLGFPAQIMDIVPTLDDLARMYANADLALAFSLTNPSLVPYEMMASGCPVVDLNRPGNEFNYAGRRDIALLADPMPEIMAGQIKNLLENPVELALRRANGLEFVQTFPDELGMAKRVEALIINRLSKYDPAVMR